MTPTLSVFNNSDYPRPKRELFSNLCIDNFAVAKGESFVML